MKKILTVVEEEAEKELNYTLNVKNSFMRGYDFAKKEKSEREIELENTLRLVTNEMIKRSTPRLFMYLSIIGLWIFGILFLMSLFEGNLILTPFSLGLICFVFLMFYFMGLSAKKYYKL